jgi:hypothetical protein
VLIDIELLITPSKEGNQQNVVHVADRALSHVFDDGVHKAIRVVDVTIVQLTPGLDEAIKSR